MGAIIDLHVMIVGPRMVVDLFAKWALGAGLPVQALPADLARFRKAGPLDTLPDPQRETGIVIHQSLSTQARRDQNAFRDFRALWEAHGPALGWGARVRMGRFLFRPGESLPAGTRISTPEAVPDHSVRTYSDPRMVLVADLGTMFQFWLSWTQHPQATLWMDGATRRQFAQVRKPTDLPGDSKGRLIGVLQMPPNPKVLEQFVATWNWAIKPANGCLDEGTEFHLAHQLFIPGVEISPEHLKAALLPPDVLRGA